MPLHQHCWWAVYVKRKCFVIRASLRFFLYRTQSKYGEGPRTCTTTCYGQRWIFVCEGEAGGRCEDTTWLDRGERPETETLEIETLAWTFSSAANHRDSCQSCQKTYMDTCQPLQKALTASWGRKRECASNLKRKPNSTCSEWLLQWGHSSIALPFLEVDLSSQLPCYKGSGASRCSPLEKERRKKKERFGVFVAGEEGQRLEDGALKSIINLSSWKLQGQVEYSHTCFVTGDKIELKMMWWSHNDKD